MLGISRVIEKSLSFMVRPWDHTRVYVNEVTPGGLLDSCRIEAGHSRMLGL